MRILLVRLSIACVLAAGLGAVARACYSSGDCGTYTWSGPTYNATGCAKGAYSASVTGNAMLCNTSTPQATQTRAWYKVRVFIFSDGGSEKADSGWDEDNMGGGNCSETCPSGTFASAIAADPNCDLSCGFNAFRGVMWLSTDEPSPPTSPRTYQTNNTSINGPLTFTPAC